MRKIILLLLLSGINTFHAEDPVPEDPIEDFTIAPKEDSPEVDN